MCAIAHLIKINCMKNIIQQQSLVLSHLFSKGTVIQSSAVKWSKRMNNIKSGKKCGSTKKHPSLGCFLLFKSFNYFVFLSF